MQGTHSELASPSLPAPLSKLSFHRFAAFADDGLIHAVATRHGGVSQAPWASLNLGGSVKDDPAAVSENHERLCAALGIPRAWLVTAHLTHSANVVRVTPADRGRLFENTDGLIADARETYLIMRYADCVPVLLFDPVRRAVGIAHAGWRGTLAMVAQRTALAMVEQFGCEPAHIRAAIGPAIGPCCYEVGDEVVAETWAVFGNAAEALLPAGPRRRHLDLWAANRAQLQAIGLKHVETAELCTACHVDDYFSHRAEAGRTGRFGAVIGLK